MDEYPTRVSEMRERPPEKNDGRGGLPSEAAELLGVTQKPEKANDPQPSDDKEKPTTQVSSENPNPEIKQDENEF